MPFPNDLSTIGINFHRETFFSSDWSFLDLIKRAAPFASRFPYGGMDSRTIAIDANGWPQSLQANQWATTIFNTQDAGTYKLAWGGSVQVSLQGFSATNLTPNSAQYNLPANTRVQLNITSIDPANPIKGIQLYKLPQSPVDVYHPLFLNRLGKFSTLRFMEWNRCDEVTAVNWADRTPATYAVQTGTTHGGVAYEYQIELCNQIHANYWLNIPYSASDDYVRNLAELVRDKLDPSLKVYIEYSNEVWNGVYAQNQYCQQQGRALNLDPNPYVAGLKYQSQRSVQIFGIFEQAFGGLSRLVRVMASFVGVTWQHQTLLSWQGASAHVDALAIAPYFGIRFDSDPAGMATQIHNSTVDQLADYLVNVCVPQTLSLVSQSAHVAKAYAKSLIGYEGGQHLVTPSQYAGDTDMQNKFDALNNHPRMADAYRHQMDGWRQLGGELLCQYAFVYTPNPFGRWGLIQPSQDAAISACPKYQAVSSWIDANPRRS